LISKRGILSFKSAVQIDWISTKLAHLSLSKYAPVSRRNRRGQKQGFQTHLHETENQVKRLEQVSQLAGLKAQGVDCRAIDGISREANKLAGEVEHESVLNAALAAAQAVEHYEITRYGTLIRGRTHWATGIVSRCCSRVSTRKRKPTKADGNGQTPVESQGSLKDTVTHLGAPPVTIAPFGPIGEALGSYRHIRSVPAQESSA
jgi:hypothetical protein